MKNGQLVNNFIPLTRLHTEIISFCIEIDFYSFYRSSNVKVKKIFFLIRMCLSSEFNWFD